jgi:hypothetical protein
MTTIDLTSMVSVDSVAGDGTSKKQKAVNIGRFVGQCSAPRVVESMDPSRPRMVRSVRNGTVPLRGGDCIFNWRGDRATLSVAWDQGGGKYGLTVAHLVTSVPFWELGEPIFAFNSDMPVEWTDDDRPVYKRIKVGKAVSIDHDTDSLIFRIEDYIKIDPKGVTISPCWNPFESYNDQDVHHIEFIDHNTSAMLADIPKNTRLMGFGAAQRAVFGRRTTVYSRSEDTRRTMKTALDRVFRRHSRVHEESDKITVRRSDNELKDMSDCGLLYIDEAGKPCCMHITTQVTRGGAFLVFAVGFREIMKSHTSYFDFKQSPAVLSSTPMAPDAPEQRRRNSYLIESSDYSIVIDGATKPWSFKDEHVRTVPTSVDDIEMGLFEPSSLAIGDQPNKFNRLFSQYSDSKSGMKSLELERVHEIDSSFETLVMPNLSDDSDDDS